MRELRLYVMDGDEPAGRWRIVDRTLLEVAEGDVWVTVEGRPDDHWLGAGASLTLLPGMRVWVSAGPRGATFAFGPLAAPAVRTASAWWRPFAAWRDGRRHAAASLPT
ncbi:DUF2917 domain-containing protein [Burkholderia cenocepacia]|uniref:DUF2917 domain-containing protein n=1 Tax=Burkholderia cenocepacia TaxID=95486 RepID=A0AAW4TPG2_9BURK|nr:DUF2917 domain-containing protein [Burkholderia cenocepacia]MBR8273834.1 DUF2917 domain-containing protein [Burkholderia cenocepacia]MCA8383771.1 DUF2917 domain-containing protein [Burkholderia cenocepacia]